MTLLVPFFFAHQPFRLKAVDGRAGGPSASETVESAYFDDALNRDIFRRVAERCYRPATRLLLDLVQRHADRPKPFRLAYGLSGTFLMQAERFAPDLLDLWREMAQTGLIEFTGETYYHSLAGLFADAETEFRAQAILHQEAIQALFGQKTSVFRNTEMIYNEYNTNSNADLPTPATRSRPPARVAFGPTARTGRRTEWAFGRVLAGCRRQ